jgi:hypothetical protein
MGWRIVLTCLDDFHPDNCPTARDFTQGRCNWLALSLLILAIFSTVFSCVYLVISLRAPRWGKSIRTGGPLSPSGANILTQLFAKLIEMSFVAVFVAFLGQVISRRAISRNSRGITLAELGMRNWIMQPGSIVTHYETVRFAALTVLGAIALTVAILATLYTTAASALGRLLLILEDGANCMQLHLFSDSATGKTDTCTVLYKRPFQIPPTRRQIAKRLSASRLGIKTTMPNMLV